MIEAIKNRNGKQIINSQYKSYLNYDEGPCNGIKNISIFIHKARARKRKKYKVYTYNHRTPSKSTPNRIEKCCSLVALSSNKLKLYVAHASHSGLLMKKSYHQNDPNYFIDLARDNSVSSFDYSKNSLIQTKWTVYRCQLSTKEESCCCSCNSDAMFEVMKSLYDCYKKKNCDHCNCILCGHLPKEERDLAGIRKSLADIGAVIPSDADKREKTKKALSDMAGKSGPEKEKILRDLAMANIPLPEPKTPSERNLHNKVRKDLGLPPEPDNPADKAKLRKNEQLGIGVIPLEGKTPQQKEKILRGLADKGIPLPEGRTPSEKALIDKIMLTIGIPLPKIASEKFRNAKTPEDKEKVLKDLANQGLPFPEGITPSEKKLIDKVRNSLGLPPEPKTPSMREKYNKAANDGLLKPLEGKTPAQKEKILLDLADRGIPLPQGRTPSEKALIGKLKARPPAKKTPSEKIRKAKAAGLITPLKGKTPEQRAKILKGLADMGIPFPEGKTPSEKKLIAKIRADLGLPPEPKTPAMRDKYNKAANDGLMVPLEGKTPAEKEKILQGLANRDIPLPEGRTPSEKALIAKVKARPKKVSPPSEKIRKAKAAGLMTPLEGKTPQEKEKLLKGLANMGLPLPEGKTPSEKKLINKIRLDIGLPPEPKTPSLREKYDNAANEGLLVPLQGKTPAEKEKILQNLANKGIPLPEGRTPSAKALIAKVKARPKVTSPSEKIRNAKAAGLITPLKGKTPEERDKILKGLAYMGIPLPEGKTPSEKKNIAKIRAELGLPPEPKNPAMRDKHNKAANDGLLVPLEGKTPAEKETILKDLAGRGIPLPEGRTPSEKALIANINFGLIGKPLSPSEKMRNAKAAGLITPLQGKTPDEREKILKGLANMGIPLPEGKTPSLKKIITKIRAELGLPPEPKTPEMRDKHNKAANDGVLLPLEGKTPAEKENILKDLAGRGIPLPEGRTPSERALIAKINLMPIGKPLSPSDKMRQAKADGLLTPLKGKTPKDKEKILRGLAMLGLPLPEGKTKSEKDLIIKVRADLGLPPEPTTPSMRDKYNRAAKDGNMFPLEGKTTPEKEKILKDLLAKGIPLPEGRTPSEKSLINRIKTKQKPTSIKGRPSDRLRQAKAEGLITPLKGKTPEQKENILKGLAMYGLPLPEGQTPSDKKLVDKVRNDLGLPPEPKTPALRNKYKKAADAGLMVPLEGKTPEEKEKILKGLADMGLPLPEGRSPSEKALIAGVKGRARPPSEGRRSRRSTLGAPPLPVQERKNLDAKTAKVMKEGKGPSEECICDLLTPESEREKIAKGLVPGSVLAEKLRDAKAAGLLTPLEGKTPEQKDKILRGLAKRGLPLPESTSPSEKKLIDKVRGDLGLPPEPKTPSTKQKYAKAQDAGLITPLEGKTPAQKEKILKGLNDMGVPLPEGRTPSEKALIGAVKKGLPPPKGEPTGITSEKIRKAKAAGLLTPLDGKTPEQKDKILRGLAKAGFPLPEGKSPSDKALVRKIKSEFKIPEDTAADKMRKARAAGLVTPLRGKTPAQKEKILRGLAAAGLPLPEGKTPSEKDLIKKVKADTGYTTPTPSERMKKAQAAGLLTPLKGKTPEQKQKALRARMAAGIPLPEGTTPSEKDMIKKLAEGKTPSEKLREARAAGFLTPLQGKTPEQKEKILKGLAKAGLPLPEAKTPSDRAIANKVRSELGLPPEPRTPSLKEKYKKAQAAGIMTPLEGKTPAQKENILKKMQDAGLPLPEGRTPSEKSMVKKLKAAKKLTPAQKLKNAKAAGLLTPLEGKTPAQKEKILKGLGKAGLPLPEGKTPSEKDLINKVRKDLGLPPEPKSPSMKDKMRKAQDAGIITPLEGKTPAQKEKILKDLDDAGIPLPEGRTPSEKALVGKVRGLKRPSKVTSEKLRKAKAAGLMTPLEGKKQAEKEKIIRGLADLGLPLPEGTTPSEKSLINKVRTEKGIPPPAKTPSEKEIVQKAKAEGLLTPIAGKTPKEKERILKGLADAGLPLPVGTTPSEKALVKKVRADAGLPLEPTPSEKRGKIKTKAKKVGAGLAKLSKAKAGIGEEFEDIVKTTKCDRGCGCDKKKIRFKHSYVKIRVTSPDFSSICACPDECFPRIKGGVITDNEGIKVTVGSAVGVPSYSKELRYNGTPVKQSKSLSKILPDTDDRVLSTDSTQSLVYSQKRDDFSSSRIETYNPKIYSKNEKVGFNIASYYQSNDSSYNTESDKAFTDYDTSSPAICEDLTEESDGLDTSVGSSTGSSIPISVTVITRDYLSDTYSSISSIRTESSLKLSTTSSLSDVYRASLSSSNKLSSESVPSIYRQKSSVIYNDAPYGETYTSDSNELINQLTSLRDKRKLFNANKNQNEFLIFRVTQNKFNCKHKTNSINREVEPFVIINDLNNNSDIVKMVDDLLSKREFSDTSLFLVVPSSDENSIENSSGLNSTICIQETDTDSNCANSQSAISVRKQSTIGTTPKEEYHDQLLNDKCTNYSTQMSISTINDSNMDINTSSTSNYNKKSKKLQKITAVKDKATRKTSNTSTAPSNHEKTTKKSYFKQFTRNKRAMKNRADVTSTSASSLDRRPHKSYMKWTKRSASHGRPTTKHFKKERLQTTENAKSFKVNEPLQVQTLFRSVKTKSHKRCQVAAPRSNRKANVNNIQDGDDKLHVTVSTQVSSSRSQRDARLVDDTNVEKDKHINAMNVFRACPGRSVCPLHGINWSLDKGFDTDISSEYGILEQNSESSPCPIHGYNASKKIPVIEKDVNSSTLTSAYYSSEVSVGVVHLKQSLKTFNRIRRVNKLLDNLRSVFHKNPASCKCPTKHKPKPGKGKHKDPARKNNPIRKNDPTRKNYPARKSGKPRTADCRCGSSKLSNAISNVISKSKSWIGDKMEIKEHRKKGKSKSDGVHHRHTEEQRSKDNEAKNRKDSGRRVCECGVTSSESKKIYTKDKFPKCKCTSVSFDNTPHMRHARGDKHGRDKKGFTCECEVGHSDGSGHPRKTSGHRDKHRNRAVNRDNTPYTRNEGDKHGKDKTGFTCECEPAHSVESGDSTKSKRDNISCKCGHDAKEKDDRPNKVNAHDDTCKCTTNRGQHITQDHRDKPRKVKDVECQCWPSDTDEYNIYLHNVDDCRDIRPRERKRKASFQCQCDDTEIRQILNPQEAVSDICLSTKSFRPRRAVEYAKSCELTAPQGLLSTGQYHDLQLLYLRDVMKMFSECSQTTSGFTLNVWKKPPADPNPSYKKVMKFYKKHAKKPKPDYPPECEPDQLIVCGCPLNPEEAEAFQGFKLAVGAKGHCSKGLSGILCKRNSRS